MLPLCLSYTTCGASTDELQETLSRCIVSNAETRPAPRLLPTSPRWWTSCICSHTWLHPAASWKLSAMSVCSSGSVHVMIVSSAEQPRRGGGHAAAR